MNTLATESAELIWRVADTQFSFLPPPKSHPLIMGIVNTTPDSFSDGGRFMRVDTAVSHALQLVADGADIIDIGGQSTRPGSDPVSLDEELSRVVPAVEALHRMSSVLISIDTSKAEVARQSIAAGACILNDVTALREDPAMIQVAHDSGAGIIIMHMQGTPKTMQRAPVYRDVAQEVTAFLADRLDSLAAHGIERERVVVDPGIGFGKTFEHNVTLIRQLGRLRDLNRPICLGASRKGFIGKILNRPTDQLAVGTAAVSVAGYCRGAHIFRVHDVAATRDAIAMTRAIDCT